MLKFPLHWRQIAPQTFRYNVRQTYKKTICENFLKFLVYIKKPNLNLM
jgi:hypothetical protein